ncbi:toprim domain-containing protein [uncultured Draconibacterium sp.]|uniref:toprim domain-containing protein n=1 Tax=uncultured Draconibacterium sp. TaxID=1573823 RepID=UPI002624B789|nr:toprim domain-containing protein [uncultured Draconibacterium sp.]
MNTTQIKDSILISNYLRSEGFKPVRQSGNELFYRSPIREDNDPSFTVNDSRGVWFDHGSGKGGSIIDLVMEMKRSNLREAIQHLNVYSQKTPFPINQVENNSIRKTPQKKHEIASVKPLGNNFALTSYLQARGVFTEAVKSGIVSEVYYDYIDDSGASKRYFGVGWSNDVGGYDVRSKYGKICIGQKDLLTIGNGERMNAFEGAMDFLSALKEKEVSLKDTNIILNSTSLTKKAIDAVYFNSKKYSDINLYFDNDKSGNKATIDFQIAYPLSKDKRYLFSGFSDYNEKIISELPTQKKSLTR